MQSKVELANSLAIRIVSAEKGNDRKGLQNNVQKANRGNHSKKIITTIVL